MKKKSPAKAAKGIWSKVYVIEGEPNGCALALDELRGTLKSKVIRVSEIDALKTACQAFQFSGAGTIVLVQSPKSEMLTTMLDVANSPSARCAALIAYYPDSYSDRRTAFISEASKRNRIYEYAYCILNDAEELRSQLNDWENRSGVKIAVKAKPWIIKNAPFRKTDIRSSKGLKEELVYDIQSLESDLNKLADLAIAEGRDVLSIDDLIDGIYTYAVDNQWDYCDAFILGNESILNMEPPDQNYVGATRMIASQCQFAALVKSHGDKAIDNSDVVAMHISSAEIAAQYPLLGGKSDGYKKIHPFRVKMTARKFKNVSLQRIMSLLELCNTATNDMLSGHNHSNVYDMMILASLNQMKYCKFVK